MRTTCAATWIGIRSARPCQVLTTVRPATVGRKPRMQRTRGFLVFAPAWVRARECCVMPPALPPIKAARPAARYKCLDMKGAEAMNEVGRIALPEPAWGRAAPLLEMLRARRSSREFSPESLALPVLSALLWAAFGVNRDATHGRTAPSAHDWQEIEVYAVQPEGAYRYDATSHALHLVKSGDLRPLTGTQDFVGGAPLDLVYVADFGKMHDATAEQRTFYAAADAAVIAQNVYLFCAAAGLATVVRGLIDRRSLAAALGLAVDHRIVLAQTVGRHRADR